MVSAHSQFSTRLPCVFLKRVHLKRRGLRILLICFQSPLATSALSHRMRSSFADFLTSLCKFCSIVYSLPARAARRNSIRFRVRAEIHGWLALFSFFGKVWAATCMVVLAASHKSGRLLRSMSVHDAEEQKAVAKDAAHSPSTNNDESRFG